MRANMASVVLIALLFLLTGPALMTAQAHTASAFTVLVQEDSFSQSSPEIIQNDSIIWYNVDNNSNLTHRLVYDFDGDGLYNGTFDWDSGNLSAYCETDDNNTKIDGNCSTSFMVIFDTNWTAGDYDYQDLRSDGSAINGTIRLFEDVASHMNSTAPTIGSTFGVTQDDGADADNEDDSLTPEQLLLYVAISTGIASVLLLVLLVMRRSPSVEEFDIAEEHESEE